ncbi:MAG: hypothetical protein KAS32_25245 [Candidatus Peribacteraceae bacterium]|nr:hypothetical protein [Candidatus Peribacteraceae bacterium]
MGKNYAEQFHQTVIATTKAQGENWGAMGDYCLANKYESPEVHPPVKDGKLDNSSFVTLFKTELGDVLEADTTVRAFQKYVSTVFNAKTVVMNSDGGVCKYTKGKGDKEVTVAVSMETLFNYENKGIIAPKHVFDGVIKSTKAPETALEFVRRVTEPLEKKLATIGVDDILEIDILIGRVMSSYTLAKQAIAKKKAA